ncbi:hypothetical protein GCM10007866_03270 [Gluconobacter albidus]|uniref:Uncharacterized protein n=2 Tax=Gluconobacter albidus TaxID=318683 RepID=A0ABQ5WWV7_9PROT|nr:hypothetical protein GCM10007866_03270 [Gluconobacter albidus]
MNRAVRYGGMIETVALDLPSLASVHTAVVAVPALIRDHRVTPQVLILNADAQLMGAPQYSVNGYGKTFATNCLGH